MVLADTCTTRRRMLVYERRDIILHRSPNPVLIIVGIRTLHSVPKGNLFPYICTVHVKVSCRTATRVGAVEARATL